MANTPERTLASWQIDNQLKAEAQVWQGWADELIKKGPSAVQAAQEVAASAARYYALETIRRSYFD